MKKVILAIGILIGYSSCSNFNNINKESNQQNKIMLKDYSASYDSLDLKLLKIDSSDWSLNSFNGWCYHDTIVSSIWLRIEPDQKINMFSQDSNYIIVKAEFVNKSPIDVFIEGNESMLKIAITERFVEKDEETELGLMTSAGLYVESFKLVSSPDWQSDPFKEIWSERNSYVNIKSGTRKLVNISIPKRVASLKASLSILFNPEETWYACDGTIISHRETINSNVVDLGK